MRANPPLAKPALFYREISRQRLPECQAADLSGRIQMALDAGAVIGIWVWCVDDDILTAVARHAKAFGLSEQEYHDECKLDKAMASLPPDDVARVAQSIDDALSGNGAYRCEYQLRQGNVSFRGFMPATM